MKLGKNASDDIQSLLPWYLNDTLSAAEKRRVEAWLRRDPAARSELEALRRLRASVSAWPQRYPSPAVRQRVMRRLGASPSGRAASLPRPRWQAANWLGASLISLLVLALLWFAIQPGVALQWSVADGGLSAFRIYRAPQGSSHFELLSEIPARDEVSEYHYVDALLLPGQTYVYRVEGVGQMGQLAVSQSVSNNPLAALPGQLAVLFTSLVVGYSAVLLLQTRSAYSPGGRYIWPG